MATSQCLLNYKMKEIDIIVPNIGDFTDVEVIEVLVNEGQDISKNDPLITIESDKSSVEIPSNFEGKVKSLKVKVGDKVSEGSSILIIGSDEEKWLLPYFENYTKEGNTPAKETLIKFQNYGEDPYKWLNDFLHITN